MSIAAEFFDLELEPEQRGLLTAEVDDHDVVTICRDGQPFMWMPLNTYLAIRAREDGAA